MLGSQGHGGWGWWGVRDEIPAIVFEMLHQICRNGDKVALGPHSPLSFFSLKAPLFLCLMLKLCSSS